MNPRIAGLAALLLPSVWLGCGHSHGPFGYSHHPFTAAQIEAMLGDYPNPGPNISSLMHDTAGNLVVAPVDRAAFATVLVSFDPGKPAAIVEASNPREALGIPDYTTNEREPPHALSLGNGGSIVLQLVGEPLMDVAGPDIFVFEAGPSRESVSVDISPDGTSWTSVGDLSGGPCAVDIAPFVKPGDVFRYVRLRDVANSGGDSDPWPGADIDAVGVVRSTPAPRTTEQPPERISISTEVLFGFDSDALRAGASTELDRVVQLLSARPTARLSIEGHTDDVGDDAYNLSLSERRARAVKAYLVEHGATAANIEARGLGETRPVMPNDTDVGRLQNRRVELIVTESP